MSRTKWLIYTVVLGLVPAIMRLLLASITGSQTHISWVASSDLQAFAIVLAITNINSLENNALPSPDKKTLHVGISIVTIILVATLIVATVLADANPNIFKPRALLVASLTVAVAASIHSYAVVDRLISMADTQERAREHPSTVG